MPHVNYNENIINAINLIKQDKESKTGELTGAKLILEPMNSNHCTSEYISWMNDPVVCFNNRHGEDTYTIDQGQNYICHLKNSSNTIAWALLLKSNHKHIGNISLNDINWRNSSGEISILIGDQDAWGKGFGEEACGLVREYAFERLRLHRVWLEMTTRNKSMVGIARRLGFTQCGIVKEAMFKLGEFLDLTLWSCLNPKHT